MKFNIFSSSTRQDTSPDSLTDTLLDDTETEKESVALSAALHTLLEGVTQSFKGQDNIKRLCDTILNATPRLRLIWIGFCESETEKVVPYVTVGECLPEATDWYLPKACFDFVGPYSQASMESVGALNDLNSLFAPWRGNMNACSVNCALAIPLRSDKPELRGLIVFYADNVNYFSNTGVPPFQAFCYVAEIIWQQSNLMQMLTKKAQLDALTGLMNRRKTMYMLKKAIEHSDETAEPFSIMICRIDGFGKLNEIHGWSDADGILTAFTKEILSLMRPKDSVGRWTGVEFLYVLPHTDTRQAEFLARVLRDYFSDHSITVKDWSIKLPLSVGFATYSKEHCRDLDQLLTQADASLVGAVLPSTDVD